jgi:Long-chain acyl-CoA synthetases (AMP-forming)
MQGSPRPSIISGIPLSEEPGLGALTLSGYLREVTERFAEREALVMHEAGGVTRWSYADLWAEAMAVARALVACGVGKGTRVGVLMTNRPEWLSATFGTALAGGIAVGLSTFSTPVELDYLLRASGVSVLLLEHHVLKKDFAAILRDLVPEAGTAKPGEIESLDYPYLRHLAMCGPDTGDGEGAIEGWSRFLARGADVPPALIDAMAATVAPSDPGLLFFSSGLNQQAQGHPERASRRVPPALAMGALLQRRR